MYNQGEVKYETYKQEGTNEMHKQGDERNAQTKFGMDRKMDTQTDKQKYIRETPVA